LRIRSPDEFATLGPFMTHFRSLVGMTAEQLNSAELVATKLARLVQVTNHLILIIVNLILQSSP